MEKYNFNKNNLNPMYDINEKQCGAFILVIYPPLHVCFRVCCFVDVL